MNKRIAVFAGAVAMDNQQKTISAILEEAKKRDILCYIFSCHVSFSVSEETFAGAYNIMKLPGLDKFDGIIFWKNTIQYSPLADDLEERIIRSGVPAVCIDNDESRRLRMVTADNYDPQYEIIKHLYEAHNARKIYYVCGYEGNSDSRERYEAYRDACRDLMPDETDNRVYRGDFSLNSGRAAVEKFDFDNEPLPDAIVCANDQMAIGVIQALNERAIRVPEDVLVTGFDGERIAEAYSPNITTINRKQKEVGKIAVRMLFDDKYSSKDSVVVKSELKIGCSCGCDVKRRRSTSRLLDDFVNEKLIDQRAEDVQKSMTSDFADADDLDEFFSILSGYMRIGDMKSCYLCLCDKDQIFHREDVVSKNRIDLDNINKDYSKYINIPVGNHRGNPITHEHFLSDEVLPEDIEAADHADYYVVSPVHYRELCFGYMVSADSLFSLRSELYISWVMTVSVGLENMRKKYLLNSMVERLNEMWIYDTMTKLYNRAGFYRLSADHLDTLKKKDALTFILFIDLDGLKSINDTYGHELGDEYISSMAKVIKSVKRINDLAMRYGGDEFVIFGACDDEKQVDSMVESMEAEMSEYTFGDSGRHLMASIGKYVIRAAEIESLEQAIHEADEKMYELKRSKKNR